MGKLCKLYLTAGLLLVSWPVDAQIPVCEIAPSCASLGYDKSEADCAGYRKLRCPLDLSAVYCVIPPPLAIGDLLFGDGTTSSALVSGKTPIGIVFDTVNRLAVALTDVNSIGAAGSSTMLWSSSSCDTPNLVNCTDIDIFSCGADGRFNTNAILASTCNRTTYAANGANGYEPSGCRKDFCKKTMWFLPSMRDLNTIYSSKTRVNNTLTLLGSMGATTLQNAYYWSSTEYNSTDAWGLGMNDGRGYGTKYYTYHYVRPVLTF